MDRKLTREALRLLEAHQPFARATVVKVVGSAPGKMGASMIVRFDGSTLGTVGGAALEERVKALGQAAIERGAGDLYHFDLAAWRPGGLPSLCGGSVDIAVEFQPARPNLLLWGGGHVAEALARLLPDLDYTFSVADDRADWASRERFPMAERCATVEPARLWDAFEPTEFTHLYLLGYDALKDLEALRVSLERFPGVIGLIASAAKREHLYANLRTTGVTRATLRRIRSPIGLDIGAESPGEIAVSVVAEIVREQHPARSHTPRRHAHPVRSKDDVFARTA
ncbi:MAG: XdhC family protein [Thermoplasmata archaeon]